MGRERERKKGMEEGVCGVSKEEQIRGNLNNIIEVDLIRVVVGLWFWLWLCHPLKQETKKVHKLCSNVTVEKEISY